MPTEAQEIVDIERQKNLVAIKNYCPFGCTTESLDADGYCHHLIGFTNDGKDVEGIEPIKTRAGVLIGRNRVSYRIKETVKPGDKLVNPETLQVIQGASSMAKLWVSSRVYREKLDQPKK